ncbi:MAG: pyruvate ferredoxin oxidoreductase, partial [Calditrichaeota bacterium]
MIEIRIHGRGGQGAVIASKVLASALFNEGKWVQSFPAFGVERRGAPVTAFTRVDDTPILLRCQIYHPDHLMILDPTLIEAVDVTAGLKEGGLILINTDRPPHSFVGLGPFRIATVDANSIAIKHKLGTLEQPIVNTAILGAYAKASGLVKLESVIAAVRESVPL